jgi:hypothetical protein
MPPFKEGGIANLTQKKMPFQGVDLLKHFSTPEKIICFFKLLYLQAGFFRSCFELGNFGLFPVQFHFALG